MNTLADLVAVEGSGPQRLLHGRHAAYADEQLADLIVAETFVPSVDDARRGRMLRALRLCFWTSVYDTAELYLSACERGLYLRALQRAEGDADGLLSVDAIPDTWGRGEAAGEGLYNTLHAR